MSETKENKKPQDYPSILNPNLKYTKAVDTDIRKTFDRIKREQKK